MSKQGAGTSYNREVLPHDIAAYTREAGSMSMAEFEQRRPYPFLLYARSTLWDPTLVAARSSGGGDETRLVDYNLHSGGMTFLSPIRKVQSDPRIAGVMLGRSTSSTDVCVPVSSVSSKHARFLPPAAAGNQAWNIVDLDSRNGTFLGEQRLPAQQPSGLDDGCYLRLGGNLIAWFLYPGRLWQILHKPEELSRLTDL